MYSTYVYFLKKKKMKQHVFKVLIAIFKKSKSFDILITGSGPWVNIPALQIQEHSIFC